MGGGCHLCYLRSYSLRRWSFHPSPVTLKKGVLRSLPQALIFAPVFLKSGLYSHHSQPPLWHLLQADLFTCRVQSARVAPPRLLPAFHCATCNWATREELNQCTWKKYDFPRPLAPTQTSSFSEFLELFGAKSC